MTYQVARLAIATGCDPMSVLEWPPDIVTAMIECLNGTDPLSFEDQLSALQSFAGGP